MKWRCIGPYRGGRVTAVTGVPNQPMIYYFGATGGGVWKTDDAGLTWTPISDGYFKTGSVGAIAVAASNPDIIYVGMGECSLRNDISYGDGAYKSLDAGKTWNHVGLTDSRHIARIRIHPQNPNLVYAASLGHIYDSGKEIGVFRSADGGTTWKNILHLGDEVGAVDLALDVRNPSVLYAGMWQVKMTPWGIYSEGSGSGLYKTADGGDTWTEVKRGLPKGRKGRIGVAVSPVDPNRIWALIEAQDGGLFRSDDGGGSWTLVNDESPLRVRHSYYTHLYADTQNAETVYVLTTPFLKSADGGRTFSSIPQPLHRDNHDLWIDPNDSRRMINGNDGGANITFNGGQSWTRLDNQPTAQMYHVTTDGRIPYRVYGAQQDNTTVSVPSRITGGILVPDMYSVAGGESGYIAVHSENPDITYGGSMWGTLTRYNHATKETRDISIWPEKPMGRAAADVKFRFNWTFPILISLHDPRTIYAGANVLFKSTDEGQSWRAISPDLTRNDKSKQRDDLMSLIYGTITTLAESPSQSGLVWAGSDDGLLHLSKDGGKTWREVTPAGMPPWSRMSVIEASPHDSAAAYLAVNRFDLGDNKPYVYKTIDYGKSWRPITRGIADDAFVRVVREDPKKKGLLYAGTETGVYVSFDDGEIWQSLQLNLPVVPVHDMTVKEDDLVIATHGRSFWILDDVTLLQQLSEETVTAKAHLFKPRDAYRMRGVGTNRGVLAGQNPPSGIVVHYYLKEAPQQDVTLEFLDGDGRIIKRLVQRRDAQDYSYAQKGMNRFEWDMRYPDARDVRGGSQTLFYNGGIRGPLAAPGPYRVRLNAGRLTLTESFQIKKDPRIAASERDLKEQFELLTQVRNALDATHEAVNQILGIHDELETALRKMPGWESDQALAGRTKKVKDKLAALLNGLVATHVRESADLRFRIFSDLAYDHYAPFTYFTPTLQLNAKFANIQSAVANSDARPTNQCYENFKELAAELELRLAELKEMKEKDFPELIRLISKGAKPAERAPKAN